MKGPTYIKNVARQAIEILEPHDRDDVPLNIRKQLRECIEAMRRVERIAEREEKEDDQ